MFVYQDMFIQQCLHDIRKDVEFRLSGHVIEDPLCVKFDGYKFIRYENAKCAVCRKEL